MSPWQLESVLDVPRNLCLKFGQNRASNRWDIWWVVVVVTGAKLSQLKVSRLKTEVWQQSFFSNFRYIIWNCSVSARFYWTICATNKQTNTNESLKLTLSIHVWTIICILMLIDAQYHYISISPVLFLSTLYYHSSYYCIADDDCMTTLWSTTMTMQTWVSVIVFPWHI